MRHIKAFWLALKRSLWRQAHHEHLPSALPSEDGHHAACWICLEGEDGDTPERLENMPCACPRLVHAKCLARWQLQKAGAAEELMCRFCKRQLPDWRQHMTPQSVKPAANAVMAVVLNGCEHRITVSRGKSGRKEFERQIRRLFNVDDSDSIDFTFDCSIPDPGEHGQTVQLNGKNAYDAAFHCAAVTAAMRQKQLN